MELIAYKQRILRKPEYLLPAVFFLVLLLAGCDSQTGPHQFADGVFTASPPANLRALTTSELSAAITIGATTQSYSASDFADGQWQIDLNIEADRTYDLLILWYADDHLIMEESGSFFADSSNPVITPDLDFVTFGDDRFDNDCDGVSNLEEIRLGLNPGTASTTPCNDPAVIENPGAQLLPWLAHNFLTYDFSNITDRVVSIEQDLRLRQSTTNQSVYFGLVVHSQGDIMQADGSQATARATIQLVYDPSGESKANFFVNQAVSAIPPSVEGATCTGQVSQPGYFCSVPLNVSTKRWYTARLVESAPFQWQAWIDDTATGESFHIGTMETPSQTRWVMNAADVGYDGSVSAQSCADGLNKVTMRFRNTLINGSSNILISNAVPGPCVQLGAQSGLQGWSVGSRGIDGDNLYSLSIGR